MTAEQLICQLRCLPPDARTADEFMQYLRLGLSQIEKNIFELRLADDQRIHDLSDFAQLLRELRDATLVPVTIVPALPPEKVSA